MGKQTSEDYGYKQELKRTLGFWNIVAYGLVYVSPVSVMIAYGLIAQYSGGMDSLVFVIGTVGITFTALSYCRMVQKFPIAGSVYSYIQRAINPHLGLIAGWSILIGYALLPAFIIAFAGIFVHNLFPSIPVWLAVVAFVVFNTGINFIGVEYGAKINFALVVLQISAILAFLVTGLHFVMGGGGTGELTLSPFYQPGKISLSFLARATSVAVACFLGFDAMTTLAEETKNPKTTIPRAIVTVLVLIGLSYVSVAYIADLVRPHFEGLDPESGFFEIVNTAAGGASWLKTWCLVTVVFALGLGTAGAAQLAVSRLMYTMGRDKVIPSLFSKIQTRFKTPYIAIIVFGLLSLALALTLKIETMVCLVNFGAMTAFLILNAATILLFFIKLRYRSLKDIVNYLVFPALGFIVIGYVWYGFGLETKIAGGIWLILGIIYGAIISKGYKKVPDALLKLEL